MNQNKYNITWKGSFMKKVKVTVDDKTYEFEVDEKDLPILIKVITASFPIFFIDIRFLVFQY